MMCIKKACLCLLAVIATLALTASFMSPANDADKIVGTWFTEGNKGKVDIYKKDGKYFGKLVWSLEVENGDVDGLDANNPDASLRNRSIIGLDILQGLGYEGKATWDGGQVYDPENGKTYRCKASLTDDGKLEVRGYIGFSLIGRTTVWAKAH